MTLSISDSINDTQHYNYYVECHYAECRYAECHYAECHYAECRYAECRYAECIYVECRILFTITLNVVMLDAVMLSVFMLSVLAPCLFESQAHLRRRHDTQNNGKRLFWLPSETQKKVMLSVVLSNVMLNLVTLSLKWLE